MRTMILTVAAASIFCTLGTIALAKKSLPDANIYSIYDTGNVGSYLDIDVCDEVSGACTLVFGNVFDHVCGVLETPPKTKNNIMTRDIFVLDKRTNTTDPMTVTVLQRQDDGTSGQDNVTVKTIKTITLDITAGPTANCKMVENLTGVYLGTDLSAHSIVIDKKKLLAIQSNLGATTVLSADANGYLTISDSGGFAIIDPSGREISEGGGRENVAGTQSATILN